MFRWFRTQRRLLGWLIEDFFTLRWPNPWRWFGKISLFRGWFRQSWRAGRIRNGVLGLPAILALALFGFVFLQARANPRRTTVSYWRTASAAIATGDTKTAELCLRRVLSSPSNFENDALFAMAELMETNGQTSRAQGIFRRLAPDNSIGNPEAHRRMAILLSDQINANSKLEDLERLHWHLEAARDTTSPPMALSWGRYHAFKGDIREALQYFRLAADQFPGLFQVIGELETQLGRRNAASTAYARARTFLASRVTKRDGSAQDRVNYAQVLMRLGQFQQAEQVLKIGKLVSPGDGANWNSLLASLFVNLHDVIVSREGNLPRLLGSLDQALQHDPNHAGALKRLMAYSRAKVDGNGTLRSILARAIAEGESPAMAHLAMGNLCWIEEDRDQAKFHFERALGLGDRSAVVMNNMAWLMAHADPPQLDQAFSLIEQALEQRPDDPNFLDTRGTIYFLQQNWRAALSDLESSVIRIENKRPLHEKLAVIYDNLGIPDIAQHHRSIAKRLENQ